MSEVNFYLKKPENHGKALIYLQFKYSGVRFKYSFGQSIDPSNWNPRKQRVKNNRVTTADGEHSLNDLLDNLKDVLLQAYRGGLKNGVPSKSVLKLALDGIIHQNQEKPDNPSFYKLLARFINGEIKFKGKEKSVNTIKTYRTLLGHLDAFEVVTKWGVDYETIDLDFLYKYLTFLRTSFPEVRLKTIADEKIRKTLASLPIGQNSIAKDVQIIKTVMKKAETLKESSNVWYRHEDFVAVREDTDAVYLTDKEVLKLYRQDFAHSKRLDQVRDLFVFGCFVGLRYSDYSSIQPEHIVEMENGYGSTDLFIKLRTKKTGDLVIIPTNPVIKEIFQKYKYNRNRLPTAISNQKFNMAIKEVCEQAGLVEKGRLVSDPTLELYKCISSHTCRRSFATNTYLSGFPVIELMKITGHTTEKSFMRYIKVTKASAAHRLDEHQKKLWSQLLLKAV